MAIILHNFSKGTTRRMGMPLRNSEGLAATRLRLRKSCVSCGDIKPAKEFYIYRYTTSQGRQSSRLDSRCKQCARKRRTERYASRRRHENAVALAYKDKHRAELNKKASIYRANNLAKVRTQRIISQQKRRLRIAGVAAVDVRRLTTEALDSARFGDRYLDAYSGVLIDDPQVDHIVPISKGGTHAADNLCVTSRCNNSSKHTSSLLEWLVRRARP